MKSMEEISQQLSRQAPSGQVFVEDMLNDVFGYLGWECEETPSGRTRLKVMAKVSDGHFLSVVRDGTTLADAAASFGQRFCLEEKPYAQSNQGQRKVDGAGAPVDGTCSAGARVGSPDNPVGQGGSEPSPAVPAGTPKPSRKVILDSISECSRVILAKKLRTQDQLVKMVEAFAVKRKEELNEGQAIKLLDQLTEITKETK